jgi:signal transduction histidine kinase
MKASFLTYGAAALAALTSLAAFWRLRALMAEAHARADRAEHLSLSRGRTLAMAAQELRGIAAALAGGSAPSSAPDGPLARLLRLAEELGEAAAGGATRVIQEAPVRLGPVVDAAVATVGAQIRPAYRYWLVDPVLRALTVRADGRALEGALAALLRRAASHSRDGDVVALRWVVASETVSIVVEDEGDGLAAADLGTGAGPGGTRGLDLGLSLARSLAAAHGGDIRLEAAPGIGARAWLTLPRTRVLEVA